MRAPTARRRCRRGARQWTWSSANKRTSCCACSLSSLELARARVRGVPLVVLAGAEYGTGSSRDWAAKGTMLLGVRAVMATSFERIHRSNLVGMGVLPLVLPKGWQELGLTGEETFDIPFDKLAPRSTLEVVATRKDGTNLTLPCTVRIDTPVELDQFNAGGILPFVLRKLLAS